MKRLCALLGLFFLLGSGTVHAAGATGAAAVDPQKERLIRQMLKLTGADHLGEQMIDSLIQSFQKANPLIREDFWTDFRESADVEELDEQIIPIYAKYYSVKDLQGFIRFYGSPLGRKLISTMPMVMSESMAVGRAWGEKVARQVVEKIRTAQQGKGGSSSASGAAAP